MEEETGRTKQAETWGTTLLVSAQNMGIPEHLVCRYLLWGLLSHNRVSFCRLFNMIQKPKCERSVRHPTVLRNSRVLLLACYHFT